MKFSFGTISDQKILVSVRKTPELKVWIFRPANQVEEYETDFT